MTRSGPRTRSVHALLLLIILAIAGVWSAKSRLTAQQKPVTNGWPVVSPKGTRVAFLSDRDGATNLYVVSEAGGAETQLTHSKQDVDSPSWSRDESEIRFAVFDGKTSSLFAVMLDDAHQRSIGHVPGQGVEVSPDGKRALYNVSGSWTSTKLVVSDLDGSNPRQLTGGSSIAWNRRWSPDGTQIAFTGRDSDKKTQIFVMKADGSGLRQLTHEPGTQVPAWSENGRELAAQVNIEKGRAELRIVDAATGNARRIASHTEPYLDEVPSWFRDGQRLAFQSNRGGSMQVWTIRGDGSGAKQLTH